MIEVDKNKYENINYNNPSFERKKSKKGLLILCIAIATIIIIVSIPVSLMFFRIKDSSLIYKRKYNVNEIAIAESNTFKKINNVVYPNGDEPIKSTISLQEKEAYNNFSNLTYHALINNNDINNLTYATVGLYSIVNEMTESVSRDELKNRFNDLLGLDMEKRISFYDKIMKANSFVNDKSTIQIKNGAFFNNEFDYSPSFVDTLKDLYCEAYQLDFNQDIDKIVKWVNDSVNTKNFINKDFLELDEETQLYLFSSLYFKNAWQNKYLKKNNVKDYFYLNNENKIKAEYMKHSYYTDSYYDYGKYISVKDYYYNGNASITYLVPKDINDNIYELTKNVNIFTEDNTKKSEYNRIMVNLKTPKFNIKNELNFKKCFESFGFADIYDKKIDSFNRAFTGESISDYNFYIQNIKQKNEVEFSEDGTIIKSISMASYGAKSADHYENVVDINLDQPFIYIIKDINDIPIFVGHLDNPTIH